MAHHLLTPLSPAEYDASSAPTAAQFREARERACADRRAGYVRPTLGQLADEWAGALAGLAKGPE